MERGYYACDQMPEFNAIGFTLSPEMKRLLEEERTKVKTIEDGLNLLQVLRSMYLRLGLSIGSLIVIMNGFEKIGKSIGASNDEILIFGGSTALFTVFKIASNILKDCGDAMIRERENIIRPKVRKDISKLVEAWKDEGLIKKEDSAFFERLGEGFERTFTQKALVGLKFLARTVYVPENEVGKDIE